MTTTTTAIGTDCRARVQSRDGWHFYGCSKKAVGEHGFCATHSPEAEAKRQAIKDERYQAQRDVSRRKITVERIGSAVLAMTASEQASLPESIRRLIPATKEG